MRNACRVSANFLFASVLVAVCCAAAWAQGADARLISARAGGVNFVAGEVTMRRAGKKDWQQLALTDELRSGDTVRTGADGRAEILLNPGSYLRLGESAEFELTDASLDALRLTLLRGSALLEAAGNGDKEFFITVATPQTEALIVRSGIYRVNVPAAGASEILVRKGQAFVGRGRAVVKDGRAARVAGAGVEVAKLTSEQKEKDALEVWGRARAEELARVNRKIQARQINTMLASARFNNDFFSQSRYLPGYWYYSSMSGCYTFLPTSVGWNSPYGFGYYYGFLIPQGGGNCAPCGHRRAPVVVANNGWVNPPTTTTGTSNPPVGRPDGGGAGTPSGGGASGPVVRDAAPTITHDAPTRMPTSSGPTRNMASRDN